MWRVHSKLDIGKGKILHPGSLSTLGWLSRRGLERLQMKGSISKVSAPPLAVLPGWVLRSQKLLKVDIEYVDQFIESDPAEIADKIGVQPQTIEKWQNEVTEWLTADKVSHS